MPATPLSLFACLMCAYVLADFALRPFLAGAPRDPPRPDREQGNQEQGRAEPVAGRGGTGLLLRHLPAVGAGALVLLLCGGWQGALPALASAAVVELARLVRPLRRSWQWSITELGICAGLLYLLAASVTGAMAAPVCPGWPAAARQALVVAAGVVLVWEAGSELVGLFSRGFLPQHPPGNPQVAARIGQLERLLVLAMVLAGYMEGVGFVLGAKLVFRIGDMSKDKQVGQTEYILLGTLASFTWAMVVAMAVRCAMGWVGA